ncbi:hypothetical protein PTW37_04935 [Arthrobacter agilis]|uniref:hypothetical protein n=1 Tax=Arthrobacter agilis TaxID=37921 RepID=UPI00236643FF|nr:hypothetical protein [Arthrobacter agilis]WDF34268.1 hypothetical protein PTW37_04935 [Arthrobacter agilis]
MSEQAGPEAPEQRGPRSRRLKIAAGALAACLALTLGVYLTADRPGPATDAAASPTAAMSVETRSSAAPSADVPSSESSDETDEESAPTPAGTEVAVGDPSGPASADGAGPAPSDADLPATPSSGSDDAELAQREQPEAEPVSLDETSDVSSGLSADVTSLEAIQAEAFGVGEIAGPAVRFVITVENSTKEAVLLTNSAVNLEYGPEGLPAVQLTGSGATPFPPSVAAGESATATLVFAVPADQRDLIRILLSVEASLPIAAFEGAAPGEEG